MLSILVAYAYCYDATIARRRKSKINVGGSIPMVPKFSSVER